MKRSVLSVLFAIATQLAACSGSGSGSGDDYLMKGEICTDYGGALCGRAVQCRIILSNEYNVCHGAFVTACCGGPPNTCDDLTSITYTEADRCEAALRGWDCVALEAGVLPPSCVAR
jgi:hypothetical protein